MNKAQKDRLIGMAASSMISGMPNILVCKDNKLRELIIDHFQRTAIKSGYDFTMVTSKNTSMTNISDRKHFTEWLYFHTKIHLRINRNTPTPDHDKGLQGILVYFLELLESGKNTKPFLFFKDLDIYNVEIQKLIQQLARSKPPWLKMTCTCADISLITKETLCCERNLWQHEWNVFDVGSLVK